MLLIKHEKTDSRILVKFCVFEDQDGVEVHEQPKKVSSYFDRTSLGNKGIIIWKENNPSGQDCTILPVSVANHSAEVSTSCLLTEHDI